jgi:hypothetical protein
MSKALTPTRIAAEQPVQVLSAGQGAYSNDQKWIAYGSNRT